jgi:hypothetical protein
MVVITRGVMSRSNAFHFLYSHHSVVSLVLLASMTVGYLVANPTSIGFASPYQGATANEDAEGAGLGITLIPAEEDTASLNHINALNITVPIDESQPVQGRINDIVDQGGMAIINHPTLACNLTDLDLECLTGYSGIEVYNGVVETWFQGLGDSTHLLDVVNTYRAEAGMDLIWAFAVDDAHEVEHLGRAWVVAKASRSDAGSVVASLRRGSFYSSTGAGIEDIRVVAHRAILVTASEESTITFIARGGTVVQRTEHPSSSASYHIQGDEGYVRVEIESPSGRAWTQPIRVEGGRVTGNPYASKGRWLKGSIHCHTTESDGACTPQEIIDWHADNGYSFLAITDHNKITLPT